MSDPEHFAARWSRLKRETAEQKEKGAGPAQTGQRPAAPGTAAPAEQAADIVSRTGEPEPPFDVASLPSIESITSVTDVRAFLQSGVPAELTKAALRRAWAADPSIRDFVGLAENQWDFTDPTAMAGFGPLEATDDLRQLVSRAMGKLGEVSEPEQPAATSGLLQPDNKDLLREDVPGDAHAPAQVSGMPETNDETQPACNPVDDQDNAASAATQHVEAQTETRVGANRRGHGRALPR